MQVEAAAALAPVLARFAIVVDGPLEAEVLSRIVAGGDRATTLADLARPFPGRPELSRPEAVALARTVVTRLAASGTVEHIGGGYRIADPALATALQRAVHAVTRTALAPSVPLPAAGAGVTPVAVEEASRLLQQTLGARWVRLPAPAVPTPVPAIPAPVSTVPSAWEPLLDAGWTTRGGGQAPAAGVARLASPGEGAPLVRVVVGDTAAPPVGLAARLGAAGPVHVTHVPVDAVRWGQGDPAAARATADLLPPVLGDAVAARRAPVVLDRGLVPALTVLARDGRLPRVVVVDLRSLPVAHPDGGAVATPEPTTLAAAMAGAAGAAPPGRRVLQRRGGPRDLASLLEVLFGPHFAAAVADDEEPDGDGVDGDGADDDAAEGRRGDGSPVASEDAPVAGVDAGVVITSRTDDPQAGALAELLGVEVIHLGVEDDLTPEVLAFLEDEDGRVLLAPLA